jgi:hypothetical protein
MSRNKKSKHSASNLQELASIATRNARERQARTLEQAELEQAAGGGKLNPGEVVEILLGLIFK